MSPCCQTAKHVSVRVLSLALGRVMLAVTVCSRLRDCVGVLARELGYPADRRPESSVPAACTRGES